MAAPALRVAAAIGVLVAVRLTAAGQPSDIRARSGAAIRKTLPLLQSSAQTWIERRRCTSCHHQALGTMAIELARSHGFAVDEGLLNAQVEAMRFRTRETGLLDDAGINAQVSVAYMLLGIAAARVPADAATDSRFHAIAGKQESDGHWFSESHRPPLEDSEFTATAVSARALQLYAPPARAHEAAARVARAREWLVHARPRTTEERTMQLFGLAWSGAPASAIAAAASALKAEQRPDGGWAQIPALASDAYATGEALLALNQAAAMRAQDPVYAHGVRFLLDTQGENGSWHVRTRRKFTGLPYFESGFPHGPDQFISYAATAWATMALVLSDAGERSPILMSTAALPRSTAPFAADDGVTPLMEASAFGTASDVRRLLDGGADVNAAGTQGLTALMAAVRDPEIVALLVAHGADVNARSASGYTPLILAAGYAGAFDAVRQLIDTHASIDVAAKDGRTALMQAARRGDARKVDALLARHPDVNAQDGDGQTALFLVADQGDAAMVRQLVRAGAAVDIKAPGVFGWTPLAAVATDGFPDVARALIDGGADVNAVDEQKRTVLDLAKLMDTGSGTRDVLKLLAAAGAR